LEFYDHVPTVWDDIKVLDGQVGQYAVLARRSGDCWYLGAMNAGQSRTLQVPLAFLDRGRAYTAHLYCDDPSVATRTHVRIDRRPVDAGTVLELVLTAQGGEAIRIRPVR